MNKLMNAYPIYLNRLSEKKTILIGGNREAERKAQELLDSNADLTVISPELTPGLMKLAENDHVTWIRRSYQKGDLNGAFLVIVAEYSGTVNQQVYDEAESKGILVNVMDDSAHCNFTFGSIVKRGALVISISTSGTAPALAVRIRERLERELGQEYEHFLNFCRLLRPLMKKKYSSFRQRKKAWYQLIDSDVIGLLRQKKENKAWERASEILDPQIVQEALSGERDKN